MTAPPAPPEVRHDPIRTLTWRPDRRRGALVAALRLDCACGAPCPTITRLRAAALLAVLGDLLARRAGLR